MTKLQHVKLTDTSPVARLTLARPPLNVLNIAMINEMNSCLEALRQKSDLCALLFDAEGAHFCAGVDVGEHQVDTVPFMLGSFHKLIRLVHGFPCPVVCAVQGNALGGGLELATICDITVAASNARLGVPEITLGVFPPVAIAYLHRLVGAAKAAELILTGALVDAAEALRIGACERVVPDGQSRVAAEALAVETGDHVAVLPHAIGGGTLGHLGDQDLPCVGVLTPSRHIPAPHPAPRAGGTRRPEVFIVRFPALGEIRRRGGRLDRHPGDRHAWQAEQPGRGHDGKSNPLFRFHHVSDLHFFTLGKVSE